MGRSNLQLISHSLYHWTTTTLEINVFVLVENTSGGKAAFVHYALNYTIVNKYIKTLVVKVKYPHIIIYKR